MDALEQEMARAREDLDLEDEMRRAREDIERSEYLGKTNRQRAFDLAIGPQPEGPYARQARDVQERVQEHAEKSATESLRAATLLSAIGAGTRQQAGFRRGSKAYARARDEIITAEGHRAAQGEPEAARQRLIEIGATPQDFRISPEEAAGNAALLRRASEAQEKIHPTKYQPPDVEKSGPGLWRAVMEAYPRARGGGMDYYESAMRDELRAQGYSQPDAERVMRESLASDWRPANEREGRAALNATAQAGFAGLKGAVTPGTITGPEVARRRVEQYGQGRQGEMLDLENLARMYTGPGYRLVRQVFPGSSPMTVKEFHGETPEGAALKEGAIELLTDPSAVVMGPVVTATGRALGAAGRAAGAAGSAALRRMPRVEAAVDVARKYAGGLPAEGAVMERDLRRMGAALPPGGGAGAAQRLQEAEARTAVAIHEAEPIVAGLEKIAPAHRQDYWNAVELPQGHPMKDISYARLTAAERQSADAAVTYTGGLGRRGEAAYGLQLRENYAPHRIYGDLAKENLGPRGGAASTIGAPPGVPGGGSTAGALGGKGFYARRRELPAALSETTGESVVTPVDVNRALRAPSAAGIKAFEEWRFPKWKTGGGGLFEERPAVAYAERAVRGERDIARAEAVRDIAGPVVRPLAPGEVPLPGHVRSQDIKNPIVQGALSTLHKGGSVQLPLPVARFLDKEASTGGSPLGQLFRAATGPWKAAVTVLGSPGYHVRNNLTSMIKAGGRWGYANVPALWGEAGQIQRGQGTFSGHAGKDILRRFEQRGFGRGGELPSQVGEALMARAEGRSPGVARRAIAGIQSLAAAADDRARLASVVGRMKENGGELDEAIDFAAKFITHTMRQTPLEKDIAQVAPFWNWRRRELTNPHGTPAEALRGHLTKPTIVQRTMETVAPRETRLEASQQDERLKEAQGYPLGVMGEKGPVYGAIPGGPLSNVGQELELARLAATGEPSREAFARYARSNIIPPFSNLADIAAGVDPFGKPYDQPVTSRGWERLAKELDEKAGGRLPLPTSHVYRAEENEPGRPVRYVSQGPWRGAYMSVPWGWAPNIAQAPTEAARAEAVMQMLGYPLREVEPAYQAGKTARELSKEVETKRALHRSLHSR